MRGTGQGYRVCELAIRRALAESSCEEGVDADAEDRCDQYQQNSCRARGLPAREFVSSRFLLPKTRRKGVLDLPALMTLVVAG